MMRFTVLLLITMMLGGVWSTTAFAGVSGAHELLCAEEKTEEGEKKEKAGSAEAEEDCG